MATYERVNWEDSPSILTPINAENLNTMDAGLAALVDEFNGYITGENERIAELNDIKDQLERRIDALCEVPNIEKVREYVESDGYKIPSIRTSIVDEDIIPRVLAVSPAAITNDGLNIVPESYFSVAENASFMIKNTVHLNLKIRCTVAIGIGTALVVATLASPFRPRSEVSIQVSLNNNLQWIQGWIRTSGEIVVLSNYYSGSGGGQSVPAGEIRICGSYIIA